MKTSKFKTNIKCMGCVAQVTPHLNELLGEHNWEVDITNPEKVLTVKQEDNVTERDIISAISEAGFKAEAA